MNKFYKYGLIVFMIVLSFAQIICINTSKKGNNINVYNTQNYKYNNKSFKEINNELNCLKDKKVLSATKINGRWFVKLEISGKKEELLNEILKLKNYNISNYIINKNEKGNSVILEINAK